MTNSEYAARVSDSLIHLLFVPAIPLAAFSLWILWWVRGLDKKTRRPFDDMPRPAGWSLQQRTSDLMDESLIITMAAVMTGFMAWALSLSGKTSKAAILLLGFLASSIFFIQAARKMRRARNHRLGLYGEQVVGRILDGLSSDSFRVFHDLEIREPGGKPWNIDHIVVTHSGVFAIETKTRRKPRGKSPNGQKSHTLIYDGQQLIFPHPLKPDRFGLDQALRNAQWLSDKLTSLNGTPIPVTPLLVFPGWWVEAKGKGDVAVMNHKQLPSFFHGRSAVLTPNHHRAIANQLEERCRIDLSSPS